MYDKVKSKDASDAERLTTALLSMWLSDYCAFSSLLGGTENGEKNVR